ncbi:MAG TPA: BrnT family toxin [Rhodoblastus sp.]|nr:BrnT family toxin [Rhodoblastus sp.]
MEFEWDEAKSETNFHERGFDFAFAAMIFEGLFIEAEDTRLDYGERRIVAIGAVEDVAIVVVYTDRAEVRRIISARRANRKERALWRSFAGR